jgi:hypothetical protein
MESGSWDDEIPNIWKNNIHVPNHQPDGDVMRRSRIRLVLKLQTLVISSGKYHGVLTNKKLRFSHQKQNGINRQGWVFAEQDFQHRHGYVTTQIVCECLSGITTRITFLLVNSYF